MINRIMYASESVMEADEAMMRLAEFWIKNPCRNRQNRRTPQLRKVAFDHVTFRYPGMEHPALDDVSFTVKPGTIVGLVGPSGEENQQPQL